MRRRCLALASAMLLACATASTQVLQPPARPVRGVLGGGPATDPNRARQELTLSGNLLGGYDDNLTTPGEGDVFAPRPSGFVGLSDARLRYWFGELERSVELTGRGYMNSYRNIGLRPSYGGEQSFRARTGLGRRSGVEVAQSLRYDPFFSLGAFGPLQSDAVSTPDSNPTNGLTERRAWMGTVSASLRHQLSRRTSGDVGYAYGWMTSTDNAGYNSRSQMVSAGLHRSLGRPVQLRAGYRMSESRFDQQIGAPLPLVDQTMDAGLTYTRNVSRSRSVGFSGGGGATYVDSMDTASRTSTRYWAPSGYGTARVDLGRTWALTADYRRGVAVLQGVRPEIFVSQVVLLSAGGHFGRSVEGVFSTGYSKGQTGAGVGQQYDTLTGTIQLRVKLMQGWSSVVSFNHHQYLLDAATSKSLGVSSQLYRNAVRVGLSWSLPLRGSYLEEPDPPPGGRS